MSKFFKAMMVMLIFSTSSQANVKIMSWNVMMVPKPFVFSHQKTRAKLIAEAIKKSDADIMVFQELFIDYAIKKVTSALEKSHPYQVGLDINNKIYKFFNSGILLASKYPFKVLDQVYFKYCDLIATDCLASKGSVLVEISLPENKKLQIAFTHLQAGKSKRSAKVRLKQLGQIKEMFTKYKKEGIPQALIGDLNINGKLKDELQTALDFMQMETKKLSGPIDYTFGFDTKCFQLLPLAGDEKRWLDHVWLDPSTSFASVLDAKPLPIEGKIKNNKACPLSDHYALDINLNI